MRFALSAMIAFAALPGAAVASGGAVPVTPEAAVIATVDAFHRALEQNDLPAATALVIADGRMAQVPGDVPGQALESGSWKETLWLFMRPSADGAHERIKTHFRPIVLVDGPAALLRQAITLNHSRDAPKCQVEHVGLIKVDDSWRIQHLTLIDQPGACFTESEY